MKHLRSVDRVVIAALAGVEYVVFALRELSWYYLMVPAWIFLWAQFGLMDEQSAKRIERKRKEG